MSEAPITQEIRLPTNVGEVMVATAKLDELIARVDKLEHASERHHRSESEYHKKSEEGWKGIGHSIEEAKRASTEFFEFIGAVAAYEVLEKIADKLGEIGHEAVHAAASAERMNFAIDAAAGSAESGENVRKWVEANGKFSEFTGEQNESAFLHLHHLGVGTDKAGLYMKAAEDLAAVSAPDQRQGVYQESLDAFARLHAKGRLDARSAMRLGIGVEDLKTLPGFGGLSNAKVFEKAEKSNLDENTLMSLIMRHTGEKAIGEKAADASQLLLTKFTKLANLPELFYKRLGETGTTKKLASEIDSILEKLDPESPTGKRIFGALESTFESITEKVGEIDFESLADTITDDVLPAIQKMVAAIAPAAEAVATTVHGLSLAAHYIGGKAAPGKEQATAEVAYQTNLMVADDNEAGFLTKLIAAAKSPFLRIHAGIDQGGEAEKAGRAIGAGAAAGVADSTAAYTQSVEEMARAGEAAFTSANEIKSPSHLFRRHGQMISEGAALGIEDGSDRLEDAMDSTFRIPADRYAAFGAFASAALPAGLARGDTNLSVTVNVQAGPGQDGTGLGEAIAEVVRREVTGLLERTGDE